MDKKSTLIVTYLNEILPNAKCELNYNYDYELLIAVILSAQTSDKKVNNVTSILFKKYPKLEDFAHANYLEVYSIIYPLGLASNKAKNIIKCAQELIEKYEKKVPSDFDILITLPGVGRKTANVVRGELFSIPCIAVDTHVERVSKRLHLANIDDTPLVVEKKLEKRFPAVLHVLLHHQIIHFGRYYCTAKKPECEGCGLKSICQYFKTNMWK